jgi:hypothetical protein
LSLRACHMRNKLGVARHDFSCLVPVNIPAKAFVSPLRTSAT